ncbi:transcriptional regulator, partial [Pseudomonas syringae pv. tagetis]
YVLTGTRTPVPVDNISDLEEKILCNYRVLGKDDQHAIRRLTTTISVLSAPVSRTDKLP